MPIVDGVILVSRYTLNKWVKDAIEHELEYQQREHHQADVLCPTNGAFYLNCYIETHCIAWDFEGQNRQNLINLVFGEYEEYRKFLFDGQPKVA